jgi:hypothetical protein
MPLARWFAFLTAGCPENEGACNRRAVAHSFLGLVCMICGAWPLCHKVGSLVHAGGDFTRDASGARVGGSAFKKGSISRAVDMPRSSCDHRALSPSGPPDGVRQCSLEGSAPRSSFPASLPPESARSWWCRRSCFLLAAVGGVQPHGSCHPSTIIRLQGFSSCSPAAVPRRWSSRRMTTSLMVGRRKPGCDLPPALSFKDVHHPCWGRVCRVGAPPPRGLVARFFPQYSREKGVRHPCRGGKLRVRGAGRLRVPPDTACSMPWLGWLWRHLRRCLLLLGRGVAARSPHGRWSRRVQVRHTHGFSRTAGCTGGSYMASYVAGAVAVFLDVLTPLARTRVRTYKRTEAAVAHRCRGGCRRW